MTENATATPIIENEPAADPAPALEPRHTSDAPRSKFIALEWPVEFDGRIYHQIRVHRVTGKEMRDFMEKLRTGDGAVMPPMIDCPLEVWEGMDADDQLTIDEAAAEFMPKRLKLLQQAAVNLDAAGS